MPRKGPAPKRPLVADPVYQSPLVTQLVFKVLVDGKRSVIVFSRRPRLYWMSQRSARVVCRGVRTSTGTW